MAGKGDPVPEDDVDRWNPLDGVGKYEEAIDACNQRDPAALAYSLLKTSLLDINEGKRPQLGRSAVAALVRVVVAQHKAIVQTETLKEEVLGGVADLKGWLSESFDDEPKPEGEAKPKRGRKKKET